MIAPGDGNHLLTTKERRLAHELRVELDRITGGPVPPWMTDEEVLDCTERTMLRARIELWLSIHDLRDSVNWTAWWILLGCVLAFAALVAAVRLALRFGWL